VNETPTSGEARSRRDAWGWVLIGVGILGILWGVFHVLNAVGGPEQRDFAHRLPYNEVKVRVHGAFLGGLVRSLAGLAVAMIGGRVRATTARRE
jgi:hypothetical protein